MTNDTNKEISLILDALKEVFKRIIQIENSIRPSKDELSAWRGQDAKTNKVFNLSIGEVVAGIMDVLNQIPKSCRCHKCNQNLH